MVFTANQIISFFEDNDQMGLSNRTRVHLQSEGIIDPNDLAEFLKSNSWTQVLENCKRPPQIANPANALVMINQQPFQLPAKSLLRLKVAAIVIDYYGRTTRILSAGNLTWVRLSNFQVEWDTLLERKKSNDELTLPIVSKTLSITAFFDAYDTFVEEFIGQANCPLKWIYRETVNVDPAAPILELDQPYSSEYRTVAEEMANRLSHNHPHFRTDNATGFLQLVTATLGTRYASTITPFKRARNGRAALLALKAQFAGPAH